jgi:protein SCO1/2
MSTLSLRNSNIFLAAIAFAVLSLLFGLWVRFNQTGASNAPLEIENGTLFPTPREIEPFQLVSAEQKPFTNTSLNGHWSVLFFGFTQCPQMCPTTLAMLNDTYQLIAAKKNVPLPTVVFISVDPDRDTPPVMKKYLSSFNKNFTGATGSQEELKRLTAALNILYMKVQKPNTDDPMSYQIDHSGTLLLVNPEGQLLALFSAPHTAETLAKNISAIETRYTKHT